MGISGASGIVYGVRILDAYRELGVETHLVVSRAALMILAQETSLTVADLGAKENITYRISDVDAMVASARRGPSA